MKPSTLIDLLHAAKAYDLEDAFLVKLKRGFRKISSAEFAATVEDFAVAAHNLGLKKGDRFAILSENRYEWAVTDFGVQYAGGVLVPLYCSLNKSQIGYILKDSGSKMMAVSNLSCLEVLKPLIPDLKDLRIVVCFDGSSELPGMESYSLEDFLEKGKTSSGVREETLKIFSGSVRSEDLACLIYTSGTTGPPKGVMLSHGNITSNVVACSEEIDVNVFDTALSILPLSHVFERTVDMAYIYNGVSVCYVPDINDMKSYITALRPDVFAGVPRLFEKIHAKTIEKALHSNFIIRNISFWAINLGRKEAYRKIRKSKKGSIFERFQHFWADILVLSKIRKALGGHLKLLVSGGAPLSEETAYFFLGAGLMILEGYGLTETSPVVTINTYENMKPGTVGKPIKNVEISIADDGEIMVKGPNVMAGYYKCPEKTREVFRDGWFLTGDIGRFDRNGFLVITDRKKDIIVTSGGKNVAPQPLEGLLVSSRFIAQAVVVGDRRNYISALIVPDFSVLYEYVRYKNMDGMERTDILKDMRILELYRRQIDKKCKDLPRYEQIKRFHLMEREFTLEANELTPTLKVRRDVIRENYFDIMAELYK